MRTSPQLGDMVLVRARQEEPLAQPMQKRAAALAAPRRTGTGRLRCERRDDHAEAQRVPHHVGARGLSLAQLAHGAGGAGTEGIRRRVKGGRRERMQLQQTERAVLRISPAPLV